MAINRHDGPNGDLLSLNYIYTSRTVLLTGKSGHIGAVLFRSYENGLVDYIAIKGHNGPNGDLLSLNYGHISLNSFVVGIVWSLE